MSPEAQEGGAGAERGERQADEASHRERFQSTDLQIRPSNAQPAVVRLSPASVVLPVYSLPSSGLKALPVHVFGWEHIAFNGDYVWPTEPLETGFRPLRNPRAEFLSPA